MSKLATQRVDFLCCLVCWILFGITGGGLLHWLIGPEGLFGWAVVTVPMLYGISVVCLHSSCSLDHLVFTCPNLEEGIEYIREITGVRAEFDCSHPGLGTQSALLSLGEDVYLEIIAPDPEQPEPAQPRPFSLDDPRTHYRFNAFAVHPDSLTTSIQYLRRRMMSGGLDPGSIRLMYRSRRHSSGATAQRWQYTPPSEAAGPQPFLIDWGATPSPALSAPKGCRLVDIRCYGPRARQMHRLLDYCGLRPGLVEFSNHPEEIPPHENDFLIARLKTPCGEVSFGEGYGS